MSTTTLPEPPTVPTIKLGRLTYKLTYANLFRKHTEQELDRLTASIVSNKIRLPVITYTSDVFGRRAVIDGATRLAIAMAHGLSVPVKDLGPLSDGAARELAVTLNADRRHLTPEEQQAARAERIERVVACIESGLSLREVSRQEKVSHEQVRQDLLKSRNVNGLTIRTTEQSTRAAEKALAAARVALTELGDRYSAALAHLDAIEVLLRDPPASKITTPVRGRTWDEYLAERRGGGA
jgi:DNA-binding CsgD family transcriptional regulator